MAKTAPPPDIDIALLLEGTFPYVSGGVSSWVNQIIRGFPELKFACIFIGSQASDYGKMKYELPGNVVHLETHYVHSNAVRPQPKMLAGDPAAFQLIRRLHALFQGVQRDDSADLLRQIMPQLAHGCPLSEAAFLHSGEAWRFLTEQYRLHSTDPSFVDYFWTIRAMHEPVWVLADVAAKLPPARAYHTISTGYAGLLGALLKWRYNRPLILSEHGIYTKERKIDLFQSEWIRDNRSVFEKDPTEISYFRQLWIRFFEAIGRLCYDASDQIVALYEANRLRQVADGALSERTQSIPNGIDLARFAPLRALRPALPPPVLCLIGRVVPIKDVKTFIRAMRTVVNQLPQAEGWVAGPEDESPEYAAECRNLVTSLGLENNVRFLGFQKVEALLPKVGVVVLSSISEALPLVLLEGYAAGVPAVSTDVGSCRQLIYGQGADDVALGASGSVVGIADPQALARACLPLLTDPATWQAASAAGIARVERYYTQNLMFDRYRAVYQQALA